MLAEKYITDILNNCLTRLRKSDFWTLCLRLYSGECLIYFSQKQLPENIARALYDN